MSKELKPYEKENEILRKIRQKKAHQHRRRIEVKAIERGLKRLHATYEHDKEAYVKELEARDKSIEQVESQILELTRELKNVFPKPKPKSEVVKPKNNKEVCDICGKEFAKSGIKGHRRACLKKQELAKIQEEIAKLEIEEVVEEEIKIDLDELTEDVSFIPLDEEPKEDGD